MSLVFTVSVSGDLGKGTRGWSGGVFTDCHPCLWGWNAPQLFCIFFFKIILLSVFPFLLTWQASISINMYLMIHNISHMPTSCISLNNHYHAMVPLRVLIIAFHQMFSHDGPNLINGKKKETPKSPNIKRSDFLASLAFHTFKLNIVLSFIYTILKYWLPLNWVIFMILNCRSGNFWGQWQ